MGGGRGAGGMSVGRDGGGLTIFFGGPKFPPRIVLNLKVNFCNPSRKICRPQIQAPRCSFLGTAVRAARIAILDFESQKLQSEQSESSFSIRAIRVNY